MQALCQQYPRAPCRRSAGALLALWESAAALAAAVQVASPDRHFLCAPGLVYVALELDDRAHGLGDPDLTRSLGVAPLLTSAVRQLLVRRMGALAPPLMAQRACGLQLHAACRALLSPLKLTQPCPTQDYSILRGSMQAAVEADPCSSAFSQLDQLLRLLAPKSHTRCWSKWVHQRAPAGGPCLPLKQQAASWARTARGRSCPPRFPLDSFMLQHRHYAVPVSPPAAWRGDWWRRASQTTWPAGRWRRLYGAPPAARQQRCARAPACLPACPTQLVACPAVLVRCPGWDLRPCHLLPLSLSTASAGCRSAGGCVYGAGWHRKLSERAGGGVALCSWHNTPCTSTCFQEAGT